MKKYQLIYYNDKSEYSGFGEYESNSTGKDLEKEVRELAAKKDNPLKKGFVALFGLQETS